MIALSLVAMLAGQPAEITSIPLLRTADGRTIYATAGACLIGDELTLVSMIEVKPLPDDPFQACAVRVLRGDYGEVPEWKLRAYERGLEEGVTANRHAMVTWYGPPEPDAVHDRRGRPCTMRTAAANLIPENAYVWVQLPYKVGKETCYKSTMRQVLDCGAHSNDRVAQETGHSLWIDIWDRHSFGTKHQVHFAVIR